MQEMWVRFPPTAFMRWQVEVYNETVHLEDGGVRFTSSLLRDGYGRRIWLVSPLPPTRRVEVQRRTLRRSYRTHYAARQRAAQLTAKYPESGATFKVVRC